jgi:hypothetical protein
MKFKNKNTKMKDKNRSLEDVIRNIEMKYSGKYEEKTIAKMFLVNDRCEVVELEKPKALSFFDFRFDIDSYLDANKLSLTEEEKKKIVLKVLSLNMFELKIVSGSSKEFCADDFFTGDLGKGEYKVYVIAEDIEECEPSIYHVYLNSKNAPFDALFFAKE